MQASERTGRRYCVFQGIPPLLVIDRDFVAVEEPIPLYALASAPPRSIRRSKVGNRQLASYTVIVAKLLIVCELAPAGRIYAITRCAACTAGLPLRARRIHHQRLPQQILPT